MTKPSDQLAGEIAVALRFERPPSVHTITSTRRFIHELYDSSVGPDASSRMATVVHELMENLAKYADDLPVRLDVELVPNHGQGHVRITASNHATMERRVELERILHEVSCTEDPRATYLSYMHKSVARGVGSGLGLARIRAECEMELRYTISDNGIIIHAETTVPLWS